MRALVTGAGGFLGRYIAEQLQQRGDQVRVLARGNYPTLAASGMDCISADIRDRAAVEQACGGMDAVFHTAAIAGIWGKWDDYYQINTLGTENVIAGCRAQHVPKLIYTSSPSVTFDGSDQLNQDETAGYPTTWLCHYPRAKALAEKSVLAASNDQMLTCALRPHLIWGPRDSHLVPRLIERAKTGKLRQVGDGKNLIDMIYVENAAEAHLQACDALKKGSPVNGRAYFISQGEPVNCWAWINDLLKLAGQAPIERKISFTTAWRLGGILEMIHRGLRLNEEPRMTRFLASQLARSHYFNIQRARDDFGFSPRISTSEGMRRLANSWVNG
ncbi:MAG: NAD-dependent epimerase/dehydratase family protein [Planctomycetaceae bacterium]|nr:NAD-dependent epimerase/dehydratase family protein [Planctomycetaceae bacterium]